MRRLALLLVAALALSGVACAKTKPMLIKADVSALTAVQSIAQAERALTAAGLLTPQQALSIREKLAPVITIGEQATRALLVWQPGEMVPASMLALSDELAKLLVEVVEMLPPSTAQQHILSVVASAQKAWTAALKIMGTGKTPSMTPALVGGAR